MTIVTIKCPDANALDHELAMEAIGYPVISIKGEDGRVEMVFHINDEDFDKVFNLQNN